MWVALIIVLTAEQTPDSPTLKKIARDVSIQTQIEIADATIAAGLDTMAQTALTPKPILEQETQSPPMPKTRLMQTILEANKTTSGNQPPPPQDKLSYQKPNSEVHSPLLVHLEPQSNKPKYLATTKPLRAVRYLNLPTVHQGTHTQPKDQEKPNGLCVHLYKMNCVFT
jgi:hypothetical protein